MDETLDRIVRAKADLAGARARAIGGHQTEHDGLVTTLTGIAAPWLNPTSVAREPRDPDAAIAAAEAAFPFEIGTFGMDVVVERFPAVRAAIERAGLRRRLVEPLMTAAVDDVAATPPPEGVTIVLAHDRLDEVAALDALAFDDPYDLSRANLDERVYADPMFRVYAAVLDGDVVGIAHTACGDGLVSVNGVAVHERVRRRGIGAAITAHAVRDRAGEADLAFLESSAMAVGTYRRIGFEPVATWEVWVRRKREEAVREGGPPPRGEV
jgi:ribosomal protein S18 acetylase RimI-like enzyme